MVWLAQTTFGDPQSATDVARQQDSPQRYHPWLLKMWNQVCIKGSVVCPLLQTTWKSDTGQGSGTGRDLRDLSQDLRYA